MSEEQLREALGDVFLRHWRTPASGCECGEMRLGQSYPLHLADLVLPVVLADRERHARQFAAEELRAFADELEASTLAHRAAVMRHHQTARPSNRLRDRELRAGHEISAMFSIAKQARRRAEGAEGLAAPRPPIDRRGELERAQSSATSDALTDHKETR